MKQLLLQITYKIHQEDKLAIPTRFLSSDSPNHNSSVYVIFCKF